MKLKDKVAVITGAGSGMGRAMALLFAAEGARVVAADLIPDRVEQVVKDIKTAGGVATGVVANVAQETDVAHMVDTAITTFGRLDILVNNAGIMDRAMPVADATPELWNKVLSVNLNGPFFACHRAVPQMLKQGGGVIINTASVAGLGGGLAGAAYTASKHGLIGLTKNVAQFYATKNIRCNAICPGAVKTQIGMGGEPHAEATQRLMKYAELNPRSGAPEEIAKVALFLASEEASFVNGVALVADGGWTAV